jgi:integrase
MNVCLKNKLTTNNDFKFIKSTEDKSSIFVLTWEEIMTIYHLDINDDLLRKVKEIFCFQCFTGQRYSDIQSLKWKDIKEENGQLYWYLHQIKTKSTSSIRIPLMPQAKAILNEYRFANSETHHIIFTPPSNVTQNRKLKEIGLMAKIGGEFTTVRKQGHKRIETVTKRYLKLSTHCARRTFISLSIERGMSISAIQKISGHSTTKAMIPYIQLSEKFVETELFGAWT